jgi:hypothetical protein
MKGSNMLKHCVISSTSLADEDIKKSGRTTANAVPHAKKV